MEEDSRTFHVKEYSSDNICIFFLKCTFEIFNTISVLPFSSPMFINVVRFYFYLFFEKII